MDFHSEETLDKKHGGIEQRSITVSSLLNDYRDWPHVAQVFKIERRFTYLATGHVYHEIQYGLTSLTAQEASPQRLLEIVRSVWEIENGLHYRRDVTFQEDGTHMTCKTMAHIVAAIHNLIICLFNRQDFDNHAQARRFFGCQPF